MFDTIEEVEDAFFTYCDFDEFVANKVLKGFQEKTLTPDKRVSNPHQFHIRFIDRGINGQYIVRVDYYEYDEEGYSIKDTFVLDL